MRDINFDQFILIIPDITIYSGDINAIRCFFQHAGRQTLKVSIGGEMAITTVTSGVAEVDISMWVKRLFFYPQSLIDVTITMTTSINDDVVDEEVYNTFFYYLYGKSYPSRTHFAERAIYAPLFDWMEGQSLYVPQLATVTTDYGWQAILQPYFQNTVDTTCATNIHVNLASGCKDDCGWAHAVDMLSVSARRIGNEEDYHRYILLPTLEEGKWQIYAEGNVILSANWHITIEELAKVSFCDTLYTAQIFNENDEVVDTFEIITDADHRAVIATSATTADDFGTLDGKTLSEIIYTDKVTLIFSDGTTAEYPFDTVPSGINGVQRILEIEGWSGAKCRHIATWANEVNAVSIRPTNSTSFHYFVPSMTPNKWIATERRNNGWYSDVDFLNVEWAGTDMVNILIKRGDKEEMIYGGYVGNTLRALFEVPMCKGIFLSQKSTTQATYDAWAYNIEENSIMSKGGIMIRLGDAEEAKSINATLQDLASASGVKIYNDQFFNEYLWINTNSNSVMIGDFFTGISDTFEYNIEVRRPCWYSRRGAYLYYYNADGAQRWLPVEVENEITNREVVEYNTRDDVYNMLPNTHVTGITQSLEVALIGIDNAIYVDDILQSPEVYLWDITGTIAIHVTVTDTSITRSGEDGAKDYVLTLKTMS